MGSRPQQSRGIFEYWQGLAGTYRQTVKLMKMNIMLTKIAVVDKISVGAQPESAPKQLVVLCHGYKSNGRQLLHIADRWTDILPHAALALPHAPYICNRRILRFLPFAINSDARMWYQIHGRGLAAQEAGVRSAAHLLDSFIDSELARLSLPPDAYALAGFSQGAVLVLHTGLRRRVAPRAIIAMSGGPVNPRALETEVQNRAPVMLLHGEEDAVVSVSYSQAAEKELSSLGVPVEALYSPKLGHDVDEASIDPAGRFLLQAFGKL
jgi:phospholipase/carboxylesterase